MGKQLLKLISVTGGIVIVSEVMDCFSKAQAFKTVSIVDSEVSKNIVNILDNSDDLDCKWYDRKKCKFIGWLTKKL